MVNWREQRFLVPSARRVSVDGREVLTDLGQARPVARLRYVDADSLFVSWVWDHQLRSPRTTVLERDAVAPVLRRLAAALPSPLPGESTIEALERALGQGELLDPEREQELADALTAAFVPQWLGLELNALAAAGYRPLLRVQSSPSTALLPWELMGTSDTERGIDMVDVALLLPASLRNDPARRVSPWDPDAPVVGVLDPIVPDHGGEGALGGVLGPVAPHSPLTVMVDGLGNRLRPVVDDPVDAFRRDDLGRPALTDLLDGRSGTPPGRLLYIGHVSASGYALHALLHLSDGPCSAADIAIGAPGTEPPRAPNRVALIACDSGGDPRYAEPTGLVSAFTHRGAEYVTATRWTLPTEEGLRRFVPALADRADGIVRDAVLAVNSAQESTDPIAALGAWQRTEREQWTRTGDPRHSPIIWAAFATAWSPEPVPVT